MQTGLATIVPGGIDQLATTKVADCYQCGKCTAGCPMADRMDLMPNQVVRLAQLGELSAVTDSRAIWQCVSCQACTERCPKGVDIAGIMDICRQLSARNNDIHPDVARTVVFQRAFLDTIRRHGRLYELELILRFKTRGFLKDASVPALLKDASLGPRLASRRKLHPRADNVKDRQLVQRIVDRCRALDNGGQTSEGPTSATPGSGVEDNE